LIARHGLVFGMYCCNTQETLESNEDGVILSKVVRNIMPRYDARSLKRDQDQKLKNTLAKWYHKCRQKKES
jgi:hypothetical protein